MSPSSGFHVLGLDHHAHFQAELAGKLKVALVVGGHGHDRAGTVAHQHIVGDPDRDAFIIDRVDRIPAGEDTGLLAFSVLAVNVALAGGHLLIGVHLGCCLRGGQLLHQRMLGGQHHEGGAPQRIRPGGEDFQRVAVLRS